MIEDTRDNDAGDVQRSGLADARDIVLSLDGDEAAYARLVRRYEAEVARQMWRFTRDARELEELIQDVFVEAYRSLGGYRADAPFLHWLRKIATRTGYRFWTRQRKERERRQALKTLNPPTAAWPEEDSPPEAAEYLFGLLERLEPKDRLVLTLLYFEALDTKEIARRVGWSRSLVKVRAYRARQKLREMLEEAGITGTYDEETV